MERRKIRIPTIKLQIQFPGQQGSSDEASKNDDNLPWESNKNDAPSSQADNDKLPWESDINDAPSSQAGDDNLPWDSNTNDAPSSQAGDGNLPWDSNRNDAPSSQAEDDKLPWESDINNDVPASQEDPENKESNDSTNVDDLFGGSHNIDFLKEIQKQEESKAHRRGSTRFIREYSISTTIVSRPGYFSGYEKLFHYTNRHFSF